MEKDEVDKNASVGNVDIEGNALNSTILEYYKKFGRKRDLEQYFSLNTAQGDIKDVSSFFWRRMKSQESSDSGERSRESSLEVCRISIKCCAPDTEPGSSQDENQQANSNSESPPIIVEEVVTPVDDARHSDNESVKSDDNNSQKSMDVGLDTSMNKAFSPTSSITSQRRLEWDSLADVGYYNESDKKTSASSLSTLERLALKQQYSNNDGKQENIMGPPTAHSTPVDENESKSKSKKGSKTTKVYRKDVDLIELNIPHTSDSNPPQSINVNLSKHLSLNVDRSGVSVENVRKDVSMLPEKRSVETEVTQITVDKESQTSLVKKDKSSSSDTPKPVPLYGQGFPVLINLNTFKKRTRRKKFVAARRKLKSKKKVEADKENMPILEKSGDQVSEAESFEYMPGHIYNQNKMSKDPPVKKLTKPDDTNQTADNKSSLESSGPLTTDSSKGSAQSFTKDLEKSIKLLKATLNKRHNDSEIKNKLIKEIVHRLVQSRYRDDETSTDFLSGLSFSSKKLGLREGNTTSSTSDANNTADKNKSPRPKKSILRTDKFNANMISSASQSAPNLPTVTESEKIVHSLKRILPTSNTETDTSSKEKTSSDTAFAKTSSEELYQKYLDALRREQAYKKHLRDKELFLRQKLSSSETAFNVPALTNIDPVSQLRIKDLMNDLTRNNYDDGSGDASKLEGSLRSFPIPRPPLTNQRNHSVFTLSSSGNSDPHRRSNLKKSEMKDMAQAGHSREENHFCCCPHHYANKLQVSDSSAQVNLCSGASSPKKAKESVTHKCGCGVPAQSSGEVRYLCLCDTNVAEIKNAPEGVMIYKCSKVSEKGVQSPGTSGSSRGHRKASARSRNSEYNERKSSQGSQTYVKKISRESNRKATEMIRIHEAVRMIQTDISINPRISDPSLTDIKIISNEECAQLILEQYRDVSKTSVTSEANLADCVDARVGGSTEMSDSSSSTGCGRCKFFKDDGQIAIVSEETQLQSEVEIRRDSPYAADEFGEDMTIPIKGTNMTLKVTLGSNLPADKSKNDYPRASTNAAVMAEKAAFTAEERSIGVQSINQEVFSQYDNTPRTINTLFTRESSPMNSRRSPNRKILLRANTNIGIGDSGSVRNDFSSDFNTGVQRNTYPKSPDRSVDNRSCQYSEPVERDRISEKPTQCLCPESSRSGHACKKETNYWREETEVQVKKTTRNTGTTPYPDQGDFVNISDERVTYKQVSRSTSPCPGNTPRANVSRNPSPIRRNRDGTSPCGCPESSQCQGTCRRDREPAYKQKNKTTRSTSPGVRSDASVGSRPLSPTRSPRKLVKKTRATCEFEDIPSSSRRDRGFESQTYPLKSETKTSTKWNRSQSLPQDNYSVKVSTAKTNWTKTEEYNPSGEGTTSQDEKRPLSHNVPSESRDLIMNVIQDITSRYSKKNLEKSQRKKCFKEIISILNYLLDTEESTDTDAIKGLRNLVAESCTSDSDIPKETHVPNSDEKAAAKDCGPTCKCDCASKAQLCRPSCICTCQTKPRVTSAEKAATKYEKQACGPNCTCEKKVLVDKAVQLCCSLSRPKTRCITESSDIPVSSEIPCTSSDSVTCKVLNRIRKECEKYHQRRCRCTKKCECSSTTSVSCDQCKRIHYCMCRTHRCRYKPRNPCERLKKKCVAYNLIIQTSESVISEEISYDKGYRPLKNIIVKVPPSKKKSIEEVPCRMEKQCNSPRNEGRCHRSRSLPNDSYSSTDERLKSCTVRDYLQRNRPDFIEKSARRQNFLKMINETRANNRAAQRELLSLQVEVEPEALRAVSSDDLRALAREAGLHYRTEPPKLMSEREMKQHSERIYRQLPEVVKKKEDARKENNRKTNLLMANLFKKSLQKKTLRGAVNISNYSQIIKF